MLLTRRQAMTTLVGAAGALALGGCTGRPVPDLGPGSLTLATGPDGAVYREIGSAVADLWNQVWASPVVRTVETDASVDNQRLLLAGEVDLGFVNVDVAQTGRDGLAALLRIFDSVLHLIVPAESPVRALGDLQGRSVALGLPGSGTRFTGSRVLELAGVQIEDRALNQAVAARALAAGEVEAMFSLSAMPTPALSRLVEESSGGYRFIDLSQHTGSLLAAYPGEYLSVTISAAIYPGIQPAQTAATPTLLLCQEGMDDDVAQFLTATLLGGADQLRQGRPEANQVNVRTAVATAPVPLHPGAAEHYRQVKP